MRYIFIFFLFLSSTNIFATSLSELTAHAKQPQLIQETIDAKELALASKNLAETETAPLIYHQSLSHNRGRDTSGFEYEVSFSKVFKLGNVLALEKRENSLKNRAYLLEQQKEIFRYNAYLGQRYHNYCLDQSYLDGFRVRVDNFTKLYTKKKQAYHEDEISKTELLQLDLEKQQLESRLRSLLSKQHNAKAHIFDLTTLDSSETLLCSDIYPIVRMMILSDNSATLTQEAYDKRIESTQVGLKRYSQKIESLEVGMGYIKELGRDIYTIALSVPLDFSTRKSEYKRASLLHQSSVLTLQNEQKTQQRNREILRLQKRLKQSFLAIESQKTMIYNYTSSLLPLIKKSYEYGESSVIEYLLSEQKLYQLKEKLLEKKRGYFKTLFKLYSMIETKEIL